MKLTCCVLIIFAMLSLFGCASQLPQPTPASLTESITATITPVDLDGIWKSNPTIEHQVVPLLPTELPATPTLVQMVIDADVSDLALTLDELPEPYLFYLEKFDLRPNEVLVLETESDPSALQYIKESGRVTGSHSVFRPKSADSAIPDILQMVMTVFTSAAGTDTLFQRDGGPCRPDNPMYAFFTLESQDLGVGDQSALCTEDGALWYRFGYRNIYFDILAQGDITAMDRAWLLKVASAQLAKLQSFSLSDSYSTTPAPIPTATQTPTLGPSPTVPPWIVDGSTWITEEDQGKAFRYLPGTRFGISLDSSRYSRRDLDISQCPFLGEVSNWNLNGPYTFPVGFDGGEGSCIIRVGRFWVHIVMADSP